MLPVLYLNDGTLAVLMQAVFHLRGPNILKYVNVLIKYLDFQGIYVINYTDTLMCYQPSCNKSQNRLYCDTILKLKKDIVTLLYYSPPPCECQVYCLFHLIIVIMVIFS